MKLLNEEVLKELREAFKNLKDTVNLILFTQEMECRFCSDTHQLLSEVTETSSRIQLDTFDFVKDQEEVKKYGIDKIPAVVIKSQEDKGLRFFGIPSGYEFASLIQAIQLVSTGESPLQESSKNFLDSLTKPVHLQVFVTPTCPYCPGAVILAHQMAFHSPMVTADMVEASEFPHLAQKYRVMGVPKTIINETGSLEGAAPEAMLLEKIKEQIK